MKPLPQIHPCPARGKLLDAVYDDPSFWAEEKLDGDRRIAHFTDEGVRFTGRRVSVKDGLLVEKTDNLPHLNAPPFSLIGTVLDGEIVCADPLARSRDVTSIMGSAPDKAIAKQTERGWLRFAAFDCLFYKGQDMRALPLYARRITLDHVLAEWKNPHAFLVPASEDKRGLLSEVWARGGEGIILKNSNAPYDTPNSWIKVKGEETHDVVVVGFTEAKAESEKVDGTVSATKFAGMVGAVRFAQYLNEELVECGAASGFDDATRADMTINPSWYMGRVMEVTANLREPSGKFRHPRFKQWRVDKAPEQCTWGTT